MPQIHVTQRSIPMPNPACGTVPYFRMSRYHWNASTGRPCSLDAREQQVVVVDALRPADDLAVALGRQHVHAQRLRRVGGIGLHVERLDRRRASA